MKKVTTSNQDLTILICGTNWLGDSIISMPAIQIFRKQHPDTSISILVKPALKEIWEMHSAVDEVITFAPDKKGTFAIASRLQQQAFDAAYIFPNSFRSALIPYVARIKKRYGMAGKWRSLMLTDIVNDVTDEGQHQIYEYLRILDIKGDKNNLVPELVVKPEVLRLVKDLVSLSEEKKYAAIIPGAARGDSKRWPDEYFAEVGRYLIKQGMELLLLGSAGERDLCQKVADNCGATALNLAGKTSLPEFAGILSLCELTICNDSGGMHLAAAVGSKVIAVFGLTDPVKTGPLGNGCQIVAAEGVEVSRDIPRSSEYAAECLRSVKPERVIDAVERATRLLGT